MDPGLGGPRGGRGDGGSGHLIGQIYRGREIAPPSEATLAQAMLEAITGMKDEL